jgi:hypothetical protein
MIDNLPNGMFNPVYVLCVGGLAGLRRRQVEAELEEWDWEHGMGIGTPAAQPTYADLLLPPVAPEAAAYAVAGPAQVEL